MGPNIACPSLKAGLERRTADTMDHASLNSARAAGATPRVGVGVIVRRDGLVLLGERLGAHGAYTWALPGGHLEYGETPAACAKREVLEECGLEVGSLQPGPYTNDVFDTEQRHYVTLFVLAVACDGQARVLEPTKCLRWSWFDWQSLPKPLFRPLQSLVDGGYRLPG